MCLDLGPLAGRMEALFPPDSATAVLYSVCVCV